MALQTVERKELNLEILQKVRYQKEESILWFLIGMPIVILFVLIILVVMWPFILVLCIFVPKFRKGIVDTLGVSQEKRENRFYLIKQVCTDVSIDDMDEGNWRDLHFGEYKVDESKVYPLARNEEFNIGGEFFLQFYEGDTQPCRIYPCAKWYLAEDSRIFLRE